MAKVVITEELFADIKKQFSLTEANTIVDLLETLEDNPKKGKEVGCVGKVVIKEVKYKKYRFYFVTDGFKIKFLKVEELNELIIKFVRMSQKKDQQKTIDEIKNVLRKLGETGF